jgi:hypothetical protein
MLISNSVHADKARCKDMVRMLASGKKPRYDGWNGRGVRPGPTAKDERQRNRQGCRRYNGNGSRLLYAARFFQVAAVEAAAVEPAGARL